MRNAKTKKTMINIKTILIVVALSITTTTFGQTITGNSEKPFIEVSGTAEKEIIPDEIFTRIVIREKYVNREKVTIEIQEEKLKTALKEIGVDLSNLSLSDANADYVKVKWQTKDVLTKKEYSLKASNATMLGQIFQQLSKLEINDAYISNVNHSKIDSLRKETRILAIKAAKAKADYLLIAIGEHTGKPLIVTENANTIQRGMYQNMASRNINSVMSTTAGIFQSEESKNEIEFQKIKISVTIYVKFEIK